jgi:putative acetyltransferase
MRITETKLICAEYRIRTARIPEDLKSIRRLFVEYQQDIGIDLCFQDFEIELQNLPGKYGEPAGAILLAESAGSTVACVALRPLESNICEMKRLYVSPVARGIGLGEKLCRDIIAVAVEKGYGVMRLDTLKTMTSAIKLYESFGFREIEAYCHNPLEDARYFELSLK